MHLSVFHISQMSRDKDIIHLEILLCSWKIAEMSNRRSCQKRSRDDPWNVSVGSMKNYCWKQHKSTNWCIQREKFSWIINL